MKYTSQYFEGTWPIVYFHNQVPMEWLESVWVNWAVSIHKEPKKSWRVYTNDTLVSERSGCDFETQICMACYQLYLILQKILSRRRMWRMRYGQILYVFEYIWPVIQNSWSFKWRQRNEDTEMFVDLLGCGDLRHINCHLTLYDDPDHRNQHCKISSSSVVAILLIWLG